MTRPTGGPSGQPPKNMVYDGPPLPENDPLRALAANKKWSGQRLAQAVRLRNRKAKGILSHEDADVARRELEVAALGAPSAPGHPIKMGELELGVAIGMKAAGVPLHTAAEALGVADKTIRNAFLRLPEARETMLATREALKTLKMTRAHQIEARLWTRFEREVGDVDPVTQQWVGGTAKDVDAISRAILASEKVQAGAAGEGLASGAPSATAPGPAIDLRVLIQQLATP